MTNEEAKENLIKDGYAANEAVAESIISDIKAIFIIYILYYFGCEYKYRIV